jgi:DNA-binding transcriptional MerR regulator
MERQLTIGTVARQCGMTVPNIRFYESQGIIPPPDRTEGGYRVYSPNDVRRLRLARRARMLGLSLPEVKRLVDRAFSSECGAYAEEILNVVAIQRARIDEQIAELQALRSELDALEEDARMIVAEVPVGQTVAECGRCLLVDEEHGERGRCNCRPAPTLMQVEDWSSASGDGPLTPDMLEALVCVPGQRPTGAPTIEQILGSVTGVSRSAEGVTVTFAPSAAETVRAVVEAERQCCPTIGWHLDTEDKVELRINGGPLQLDTLAAIFAGNDSA